MATQTVKRKRTKVRFAVQRTTYAEGQGATTTWQPIEVQVGIDEYSGEPIMTSDFYVEWLGSYGATAIQQQADGVIRPARVRMPYVKSVYDALISEDVRIYLHGIVDDAHTFALASAADNYIEANKMIEFQVKKYGVK